MKKIHLSANWVYGKQMRRPVSDYNTSCSVEMEPSQLQCFVKVSIAYDRNLRKCGGAAAILIDTRFPMMGWLLHDHSRNHCNSANDFLTHSYCAK
ncbi:hypothetical protein EPI10_010651 [Gossypium australe]|uniref:Uncharacterized protein n=1 Tax=Gossypium australe TaxID=47621 RepID=A0A5B6W5L1_9ROSI|nr:hypothetical protein EPI10_010651 [Gossypium australe]